MTSKIIYEEIKKLQKAQYHLISKLMEPLGGWIGRKKLMGFLDYGNSQMLRFESDNNLTVSIIRQRKFYLIAEIIAILEKNKKNGC